MKKLMFQLTALTALVLFFGDCNLANASSLSTAGITGGSVSFSDWGFIKSGNAVAELVTTWLPRVGLVIGIAMAGLTLAFGGQGGSIGFWAKILIGGGIALSAVSIVSMFISSSSGMLIPGV